MKKIITLLLVFCTIISFSVPAFASGIIECKNLGMSDECSDYSATKHMVINRSGTIADYEEGTDVVYDTKGNILTRTDEDGVVWEYIYSANGNFMYRIGTIADPEWSITETQKYTNEFKSPAAAFDEPIENCIGFDMTFEINELEFGYPSWYIAVYVDEPEVSQVIYQREGEFSYKMGEEISYTVEFREPTTVTAVCPRPVNEGPLFYAASIGIFNVRIKSYDYE